MTERSIAERAANFLTLAATPVLSAMALIAATYDGGPADILRSAAHDASPWHGMTLMYLLMTVFHAAPWVRLFGKRSAR